MTASTVGYGSAFFAAIAAILWLLSVRVKLPEIPEQWSGAWANAHAAKLFEDLSQALKKQSVLSGRAAVCAAIAAILQIIYMTLSRSP